LQLIVYCSEAIHIYSAEFHYDSVSSPVREKTLTGKLDDTDRRIMSLLSQNPDVSQVEIAKELKVSQPAVSSRIRKLEEKGALAHIVGTDVKKAQLFLANLDVATNHVEQFLKSLEGCPIYLNSFLTSGKNN
jgi:Lrp/AsnC family leucine-responsive transcriptional regulator